jgi:hypothetical protein
LLASTNGFSGANSASSPSVSQPTAKAIAVSLLSKWIICTLNRFKAVIFEEAEDDEEPSP